MAATKLAPMFREPELRHCPTEYPLLWQWHRWGDYIAGFLAQERAEQYGRRKGWMK
jgi:hypothetical protein